MLSWSVGSRFMMVWAKGLGKNHKRTIAHRDGFTSSSRFLILKLDPMLDMGVLFLSLTSDSILFLYI